MAGKLNSRKIGFMQGRMSPIIDNKIQCFPIKYWRQEFELAHMHDFGLLEWTLDHAGLMQNPLLTVAGRKEIALLSADYNVNVESVTADNFMQAPFFKYQGKQADVYLDELKAVVEACCLLEIKYLVIPLVDQASVKSSHEQARLYSGFYTLAQMSQGNNFKILLESDFNPAKLHEFICNLDLGSIGVNYDIGNSAALGYVPREEIALLAPWIFNVHIKDRPINGVTVPLGTGDANFSEVFTALQKINYSGNYILQTARSINDKHVEVLCSYRQMVFDWLTQVYHLTS